MHQFKLADINAIEIIDNRGMPTIRAQVLTNTGCKGIADVPCGSSTGAYEAKEVRDGGTRFQGKGVRKAIQNIHDKIRPKLKDMDITDRKSVV